MGRIAILDRIEYEYSMDVGTAAMPIGIEENAIEENATVQGS